MIPFFPSCIVESERLKLRSRKGSEKMLHISKRWHTEDRLIPNMRWYLPVLCLSDMMLAGQWNLINHNIIHHVKSWYFRPQARRRTRQCLQVRSLPQADAAAAQNVQAPGSRPPQVPSNKPWLSRCLKLQQHVAPNRTSRNCGQKSSRGWSPNYWKKIPSRDITKM